MAIRPKLAVLDYGMGNLRSVCKAWEHEGADVKLVSDPANLGSPDALIFPGQGAIVDCMRLLKVTGFDNVIRSWISTDRPFFGICLGMQALFEHSEEGDTSGLGVFPGRVVRFRLPAAFKVPHMGWNTVEWKQETPVDLGLRSGAEQFYFVHSYFIEAKEPELIWGQTEYGGNRFTSAISRGRCFATQFHPEKSQSKGLQIYRNFLNSL